MYIVIIHHWATIKMEVLLRATKMYFEENTIDIISNTQTLGSYVNTQNSDYKPSIGTGIDM